MLGRYKWLLPIMLFFIMQYSVFAKGKVCFTEVHTIEEDKYLNYQLNVSENSRIAGLTVTIRYNEKQLTLVDSQVGETLQSTMNKVNNKVEGTVIITAISTDEITQKGSILNLKFELLNSSKEYIDIHYSVDECIDQNCNEILNTIDSKKIKNPLYKPTEVVEEKTESSNEILNNSDEKKVPSEGKSENVQMNEVVKKEDDKSDDNENEQEDSSQTDGSLKTETNEKENKSKNTYLFTALITGGVAILILSIMIARRRRK